MGAILLKLRTLLGRPLTWAEADANAVAVRDGLLNPSDIAQGSGMIAHNPALVYPAGSVGNVLRELAAGGGGGGGGGTGADAPLVTLTGTGQLFIKPASGGAIAPSTITLTATAVNVPGATYTWEVDGVLQVGFTASTFVVASFAPTASKLIKVTVNGTDGSTAFDTIGVYSLQEGSDGITADFDNANQTVQCNNAGTPKIGSFPKTANFVVIRGATILTSASVAWSIVSSTGIESAGTTTGASANVSINTSTGVLTVGQITSDYATVVARARVAGIDYDRTFYLNKSRDGAPGSVAGLEGLALVVSSQIFRVDTAGVVTPSSINLTAVGQNVTGSPTWGTTPTVTLGGAPTAPARTLSAADFGSNDSVLISVDWGSLHDEITIFRIREGSDAYSWGLDNEFRNISCDSAGTPLVSGSGLPIASTMVVARGATVLTTGVTYAVGTVTGFTGVSINATTGVIAITGITADQASAEFTATIGSTVLRRTLKAAKAKAGAAGGTGGAGKSAVTAYALYSGNPTVTGAAVVKSGTTLPATSDFSPTAASAFSYNVLTPASGQSMFRTDGQYDPVAGTTTWGTPYLANFKVGSLSAITADLGTVTAGNVSTTGYVRADGSTSFNVVDPTAGGTPVSRSIAIVGNVSGTSQIGVVGYSTSAASNAAGVLGYNSSGAGVIGYGSIGVRGWGVGTGSGVSGVAGPGAGAIGVRGDGSGGAGSFGVYGSTGFLGVGTGVYADAIAGGTALGVRGVSTFSDTATFTRSGGAGYTINASSSSTGTAIRGASAGASGTGVFADGSAGGFALYASGNIRWDTSPTTGAATANFVATNKPGSSSTNSWVIINIGGTNYTWPVWPL